jgi:hypothetical protein
MGERYPPGKLALVIFPAPASVYIERLAQRKQRLKHFESARNQLGYWRLLAMLAIGASATIWFTIQNTVPWWSLGLWLKFGATLEQ